jgi:hypothetical protein
VTVKIAPFLLALFLTVAVPLHGQIITGHSTSIHYKSTPRLSLWLNWNASGGLDGAVTCSQPITGHVLETIVGVGVVRSGLVSVRFPGHGSFRGRMSEDGSVITGRLLFRENPFSRTLVRQFTLNYSPPTSTSAVSMTMTLMTGTAAAAAATATAELGTAILAQPVSP